MDIDLKNSLDCLMCACTSIKSAATKGSPYYKIEDLVVRDIMSFIHIISKTGAEGRAEYFNVAYLNGNYQVFINSHVDNDKIPESMILLCQIDKDILNKQNSKISYLFISFLTELGRYYLRSRNDKNDINLAKYLDYIKKLKEYADRCLLPDTVVDTGSAKSPQESKTSEKQSAGSDNSQPDKLEPEETLEELMDQLKNLIGLAGVKQEVTSLINMIKINKIRENRGLPQMQVSRHLVFLGNPGTGKTTVARILSKIYKQLGVLETGQLVEVDRAGLVAGYVGQTALKTKEKIDEAMGGILFIDEAYTLAKGGNDFGQEAIDTILKAMEDNRDAFIVIVAGYPGPMEAFLDSNPGLKSRFNKRILFEDYTNEELLSIFEVFCRKYGVTLNAEAQECLQQYLSKLCANKPENFANGREMRNLFEGAVSNQANRLASYTDISDNDLSEIIVKDLPILESDN